MTDSTIWSRRRFQNGEVIVTFMIVLFLRPFTAPPPALQLRTGFQPGSICMAINHLISCGRRHIAIIGGGETYTAASTAPRVRSRHWLSWASNRPGQSGMASGMRVGAAPPPACCSIRASRLTLWSAKTTIWPEAALTCSSSRIYAFRMTSPLSATITGQYWPPARDPH